MMLSTMHSRVARPLRSFFTGSTILLFCTAAMVSPASLRAQSLPKGVASRIDSIFAKYNGNDSPGCAMGIFRDGRLIYAKGYGVADLEHNVPITPQTVFDIGSTSKQFTATCLVLLAQQGKLSLEDDVRKHIPELPDYGRTITIRNLLNHTSGLRDYIGLMLMSGMNIDDVTTTEDALRIVVNQQGTDFETGTDHQYSNTGYFLASVIIERVSGKSLRQFAQENIFVPLGMTKTTYIDDHTEVVPNRAIGYTPGEEGKFHRDVSYWEQNGDGGVFTTVEDLLKWDENFYQPKVGGADLPGELLRRGTLSGGDTLDYALGLIYDDFRGVPAISHGGSWGGYRAEFIRIPSEHISVAVLCNLAAINPTGLAKKVLGVMLEDRLPAPTPSRPEQVPTQSTHTPVKINPVTFDDYTGDFALDIEPNFVISFQRDGDRYYSQATGQGPVELFPSSDSTFFLKDINATITFHREANGTVPAMTLHQGGNYLAHRVEKIILAADEMKPYVGTYFSPELGTRYTVAIEEGELVARHDRFGTIRLKPSGADAFSGDQWYLNNVLFERERDGKVEGMSVSAGRVQNLRFVREK